MEGHAQNVFQILFENRPVGSFAALFVITCSLWLLISRIRGSAPDSTPLPMKPIVGDDGRPKMVPANPDAQKQYEGAVKDAWERARLRALQGSGLTGSSDSAGSGTMGMTAFGTPMEALKPSRLAPPPQRQDLVQTRNWT